MWLKIIIEDNIVLNNLLALKDIGNLSILKKQSGLEKINHNSTICIYSIHSCKL